MKLSIFTTVTNPEKRGDNVRDAMNCYCELADEIIYVDGNCNVASFPDKNIGWENDITIYNLYYPWPQEFSWEFIGQQFQRGYEACSGDWVIHADLDFIFHQKDFEAIRKACENNPESPALSFYKYQFIQPDKYNLKSRLVIAVNKKKYGHRIRFDSGGDLCQPSLDGNELKPDHVPEAKIPFYNYEKMTKTKEQIKDDVERMARAWQRHFGEYRLGTDETAYEEWLKMIKGRYSKPQTSFNLDDHPRINISSPP